MKYCRECLMFQDGSYRGTDEGIGCIALTKTGTDEEGRDTVGFRQVQEDTRACDNPARRKK